MFIKLVPHMWNGNVFRVHLAKHTVNIKSLNLFSALMKKANQSINECRCFRHKSIYQFVYFNFKSKVNRTENAVNNLVCSFLPQNTFCFLKKNVDTN